MSIPPQSEPTTSRRLWEACERYHQLGYVAPEPRETATAAGLKGFWMNYFATRAAPMGAVRPETVESIFFYFAPARVHRALPDAWSFSSPEAALDARYTGMDAALKRQLGPLVRSPLLEEAIDLHRRSLSRCIPLGRPLYAAWAGLRWPDEPHLALWHATTLQREYRNGCHLIALGAAGLDGCQSIVSHVAVDQAPQVWVADEAGWSQAEVVAATESLVDRGWLQPTGAATELGYTKRAEIEALTDELDGERWTKLDQVRPSASQRLADIMEELTAAFPADDQLDWRDVYGENHFA